MAKKNNIGRPPLFIPEVRERLISALTSGMSVNDAAALAGIEAATYHLWCAIGNAIKTNTPHPRIPKEADRKQDYVDFVETAKRAQAASRIRAISGITDAGRPKWTHRRTGRIIDTPPKAITWMHLDTGETTFEKPKLEMLYEMQFSGEVWDYRPGQWQALAWFAERSNRLDWGRTVQINVKSVDRLVQAAEKAGINVDELLEELIAELTDSEPLEE